MKIGKYYTDEANAQIVIALLKAYNIRNIVASPGTTNIPITGSVQNDPFFTVYSAVDERSAAYMACGLAQETGDPVVLSCTGATASRNYLPGMTEAYYRKLPVVAITSTSSLTKVGHLHPQVIDRSVIPRDVALMSTSLPPIQKWEDRLLCEINTNKALSTALKSGPGPVHINLATTYQKTFNTRKLPDVRIISWYDPNDSLPQVDPKAKNLVFIGSHKRLRAEEIASISTFVSRNNAVVMCDHTSSYSGEGRILGALPCSQSIQKKKIFETLQPDLIIHIGEVSGDYSTQGFLASCDAPTWRVSEDGEPRDRFERLSKVFSMREKDFFIRQSEKKEAVSNRYYDSWVNYTNSLRENIPNLPFSNTWIASRLSAKIWDNSNIHFGILNSLRNWNLFETPLSVSSFCNVGGFGIDGCISTAIGSALADRSKINFVVVGDLAFFYDLNASGNRHTPDNLRIVLINNGGGAEFEISSHFASQFGKQTGDYISAGKHYGNKSKTLVKAFTEALGFKYLSSSTKETFDEAMQEFLDQGSESGPIIFECFTSSDMESQALEMMSGIDKSEEIRKTEKSNRGGIIKKIARRVTRYNSTLPT